MINQVVPASLDPEVLTDHSFRCEETMTGFAPSVFAVIVNWNGEQDTVKCLDSLLAVTYPNLHVVVSDNGSRRESVKNIRAWGARHLDSPEGGRRTPIRSFQLIENGRNLGFTGANTSGINYALPNGADYVLFLNNDTVVTPDFLSRMIAVAESDPRYGVLGCKIFYGDRTNGAQPIWSLGGYRWQRGIPINIAQGRHDRPQWQGALDNDLINGCCMLIRRAVIEQVGVQDDTLFFAMDDAEFSLRARRHGWRNGIVLDAHIYHAGSHSVAAGSPLQAYYLFRNMLFFRLRCFPWYRNLIFLANYAIRYVLMGGAARVVLGRGAVNRGMFLGIRDFFRGRMGECAHQELLKH